ncbi:MAG: pitrilysin family protein [Clostridiales bacterium]|nr:pitrilysin family protein [Clostridiales bacterium]
MRSIEYKSVGEEVWYEKLYNGLTILVVPKKNYSRTYAFFAVNYGGCDRRFKLDGEWHDTPAGVAHFLEHKMFDMPDGSNALTILSENGASPNAFTANGMTGYLFRCTDKYEENLATLLRFVMTPYFTAESVAKEQGIIAQEIRMGEDSPGRRVRQNLMRALYTSHPVRDSIAGTVESIAEITPEVLYACHKAFYNPANMVLCVSGNADPETVKRIVLDNVRTMGAEVPERDYGEAEGPMPGKVRLEEKMAVAMPLFMFGAKLPYEADGRLFLKQLLTGELACEMLMGESSELYARMYREGLINRSFYCGTADFPGGAFMAAGGESKAPYAVMDRVTEAAAKLAEGEGEKLFERLKKAMLGSTIRSLDSVENICHNEAEAFFHGYSSFEAKDILLSVEIEDCRAFLREYFAIERLAMSVVRPIEDK